MHASWRRMLLFCQKMQVAYFPHRRTWRKRFLLKYAKATIVAMTVLLATCCMYASAAGSMATPQLIVNVASSGQVRGTFHATPT